ncbi:MAG: signal peptidase II [Bdellovibrionales bacterium]|nr:signal peptidase II [Bdellovibrionales bacterium]
MHVFNVALFVTVLVLDQLTKYVAQQELLLGEIVPVIPGLFNFTLVYNPGAAFGLFGGLPDPWRQIVLFGVSLLALVVVFRFMRREAKDDPWAQAALSGILAGAVGNIIDRVRFDSVVDFLDFYWGAYHWPAFNVADSAISVGVTILIFRILFFPQPQSNHAIDSE